MEGVDVSRWVTFFLCEAFSAQWKLVVNKKSRPTKRLLRVNTSATMDHCQLSLDTANSPPASTAPGPGLANLIVKEKISAFHFFPDFILNIPYSTWILKEWGKPFFELKLKNILCYYFIILCLPIQMLLFVLGFKSYRTPSVFLVYYMSQLKLEQYKKCNETTKSAASHKNLNYTVTTTFRLNWRPTIISLQPKFVSRTRPWKTVNWGNSHIKRISFLAAGWSQADWHRNHCGRDSTLSSAS